MALPAFRDGDLHACTQHGGGPFQSVVAVPVETNGRVQRRCGDRCLCGGAPTQVIERGAATVHVRGEYAARLGAPVRHGGVLVAGSANVVIGGPDGAGLRRPPHARCRSMAEGRANRSTKQNYNNCGIESSRYLIEQATGERLTEEQLLGESTAHLDTGITDGKGGAPGGTVPSAQGRILARHGVETELRGQSAEAIASAVGDGRGVIAHVWGERLWGNGQAAREGAHAIVVTGVEYDAAGRPATFVIQDSGAGACSRRISADHFQASLIEQNPMVVTRQPIW